MIRALLRNPVLCQAYAFAWHDLILRMEALVVACDVVDAETRSRVYRMLPQLFPDLPHETAYQMMFRVACCMDRFIVVLNLMDHPDLLKPGRYNASPYEDTWDSVVFNDEETSVLVLSENVLRVLWCRHVYNEKHDMKNILHYADEWVFKWIFDRLPAKYITNRLIEHICSEVTSSEKMKHCADAIITWVLEHDMCRSIAISTVILSTLVNHPLFIPMFHRFVSQENERPSYGPLFNKLAKAPLNHLYVFLCSFPDRCVFNAAQVICFLQKGPSVENAIAVLNDNRFDLPRGMVYEMLFMTEITTDIYLAILNHPRVKSEHINCFIRSHMLDVMCFHTHLYKHLLCHPLYYPQANEPRLLLSIRAWDALCLLMMDERANTDTMRERLLADARDIDEEAEFMAQPFMHGTKKNKKK